MKKLLNNPWVVGALALAALALVGKSLLPKRAANEVQVLSIQENSGSESNENDSEPGRGGTTDIGVALKELPISSTARDPFSTRTKAAVLTSLGDQNPVPDAVDTLRLSAIWIQGATTFVVINGSIRQAGDEFSRFKIESTTRDGVWVTHWKGRDFLALGADFTLTTPSAQTTVAVQL
jgi:hypothetical protein